MQLKLFACLLVYMRRPQHGKYFFIGWQWNWSRYHRTGAADSFNDLFGGFIHQIVIIRLQFDSDALRHKLNFPFLKWECKGMGYLSIRQRFKIFFFLSVPGFFRGRGIPIPAHRSGYARHLFCPRRTMSL
jgi:hypothetical protein